jgi:hypothetical protein
MLGRGLRYLRLHRPRNYRQEPDGRERNVACLTMQAGTRSRGIARSAINLSINGTICISARLPEIENLESGNRSCGPNTDITVELNDG